MRIMNSEFGKRPCTEAESVQPIWVLRGSRFQRWECLKRKGSLYSPPQVDRIWLWVHYKKIPKYPIFYLLKGDHKLNRKDTSVLELRNKAAAEEKSVHHGACCA